MPRPTSHQSRNLRLSVQNVIGESVTLAGALYPGIYPILHESAWRDVESRRLPATPPEVAWIETRWLEDRAGAGDYSVLQADVYSRAGEPGGASGDEYGERANLIAEALCEVFMGRDLAATAGKRWVVAVLDFSVVGPPFPDTGGRLLCESLGGRYGSPQTREHLGLWNGLWRIVLRWNYRMVRDAQSPAAYYSD